MQMIVIPRSAVSALNEKLNTLTSGYEPYKVGIWSIEILGKEVPGVSFFFSDQRDEWEEKYLIGEDGMVKLPT